MNGMMRKEWLLEGVVIVVVSCLLMMGFAFGQEQKAVPKVKEEVALKIRNLQWEQAKLTIQLQNLTQQYQQMQQQLQDLSKQVQVAVGTAAKDSGVDQEKWELNPDTMIFRAKVSPVPEEKKP